MESSNRVIIALLSSLLCLACEPSAPVTACFVDMGIDAAVDASTLDSHVADMTLDMEATLASSMRLARLC